MEVNVYIKSEIRAPQRKDAAAMWLVEFITKDGIPITRQGIIYLENTTETELTLSAIVEAMNILNKRCEVRIKTEAGGIITALENNWYVYWQQNDYKTVKGCKIKCAELWEQFCALMTKHDCIVSKEHHSYEEVMRRELAKAHKDRSGG